jgi:hypothetical protein
MTEGLGKRSSIGRITLGSSHFCRFGRTIRYVFKRGRDADNRQVNLPEERKALAERYTIDAQEAEARARRAAEGLPSEEPAEWAQRATEKRAHRLESEAKAKLADAEQARRHRAEAWARARREETAVPVQRPAQEQVRPEGPILALVPEPEPEPAPELAHEPEPDPEPEPQPVEAMAHAVVEPAPAVEPDPVPEAVPIPDPAPLSGPDETTEDLPVYAWVQRTVPEESAAADWTRALVKSKETRGDDARSA